jgi:hypothetical protein
MKRIFLLLCVVTYFFGCINSNSNVAEKNKIKTEPPFDQEREAKLATIDSIVNVIDANDTLYTEIDSAIIDSEGVHNITYEESFEKKGGLLVKGISKDVNEQSTLTYVSYFSNERLIKNEASIQNSDGLTRAFVYLEKDKPIFFSGNISLNTAEAMKKQSYLLLAFVKRKKELSVFTYINPQCWPEAYSK